MVRPLPLLAVVVLAVSPAGTGRRYGRHASYEDAGRKVIHSPNGGSGGSSGMARDGGVAELDEFPPVPAVAHPIAIPGEKKHAAQPPTEAPAPVHVAQSAGEVTGLLCFMVGIIFGPIWLVIWLVRRGKNTAQARPAPQGAKPPRGKRFYEKEMSAYRYGECSTCTVRIRPGDRIWWDAYDKRARHAGYCLQAIAEQDASDARKKEARESAAFMKLLDRVSTAKGTATRKAVLERAKEMELTAEQRLQLLLEVSRAETDATLEKVEGLKSVALKRRRLEEMLAALKADDVPDALQADQLTLLEQALLDLDSKPKA